MRRNIKENSRIKREGAKKEINKYLPFSFILLYITGGFFFYKFLYPTL